MTFVTTYALILPAITVEKEHTDKVAGMYLEQEGTQDDLLEENALEFTGVSIAADQENAVTYEYADDDMTAVAVFSTEEEIPEGAVLVVNPVDTESEKYTEFSNRAALLLDREFIYDVTTCSFYDFALICDGVDVTPKTGLVDVQINFMNNTVRHVEDTVYVGRFGKSIDESNGFMMMAADDMDEVGAAAEEVDTQDADNDLAGSENQVDVNDELISTNPDESPVIELTDSIITTLYLKGNDLSQTDNIVGILAGNVDEEAKAAAAETDAEVPVTEDSLNEDADIDSPEIAEEEDTAALDVKMLKVSGSDYTVVLTYDETSMIPDGAILTASEIAQDSKEYQTYLEETKKAMGLTKEETLPRYAARFFDIKIMVDDEEFTPESGVSVEITYEEPLAENPKTEVNAVHFADDTTKAEVIETNMAEVQNDGAATVEFTAESFSVYGVIYTVDFHYTVNGKEYEYSIKGGSYISLKEIVAITGLDEQDRDTTEAAETNAMNHTDHALSEERMAKAEDFVKDVISVEFSNTELIYVLHPDKESTVGALKESLELECEYSSEMTDKQIEEINDRIVKAGEWGLISLKPFETKETLTIIMSDGTHYIINVSDYNVGAELNNKYFIIETLDNPPRAMSSTDPLNWDKTYLRANGVTDENDQKWFFEYANVNGVGEVYRLKSAATDKYIRLNSNNDGFGFTDVRNDATLFYVDRDNNQQYELSTFTPSNGYNTRGYLNLRTDSNTPRFTIGYSSQRFNLIQTTKKEIIVDPDQHDDRLLFLDEDQDDIYIHVGDTITLRPYDEWTWKEGGIDSNGWNVQAYRWTFNENDSNLPRYWNINGNENNEYSPDPSQWTTSNGVFKFSRHVKRDSELKTRYWSVQGEALIPGDYVLKNNKNGHVLTVHVLPADDPRYPLGSFSGTVPVKVNLFDYDRLYKLDPSDNSNVETGIVDEAVNVDDTSFHNRRLLHFLSSGNGNGGINKYTQDKANPGILAPMLVDGYPVLASDSTQSLQYLFDTSQTEWTGGKSADGMIAYPELEGLFQQDKDGYYFYNSNCNYAYYDTSDPDNNQIILYEHTYTQTNKQNGTFNSKPIGFFPFHDYNPKEASELWVNQNKKLNHHIGMSMEVPFEIPKTREVVVNGESKHIIYDFSGDDDLWVFVDDELVLDIGGIHQPIKGQIDFTDGKVRVFNADGTDETTKTFSVGAHTLKMFYLERGGCDSNLSLKMNMPLILGTGDVQFKKTDGNSDVGLQNAVFGIWDEPDCTGEPYLVATSDLQGIVFKNLPVREEGQSFYIREIIAPPGKAIDDTIYKATAGEKDAATGKYPFTLKKYVEGQEVGSNVTVVPNNNVVPINISVKKAWQDAAGNETDEPQNISVRFNLKRITTYITDPVFTVKMVSNDSSTNNNMSGGCFDSITAHEGDVLTIRYVHNADGNYTADCNAGNGTRRILRLPTNSTTSESRVTYTVNSAHADNNSNVIRIVIPKGFTDWCDPNQHGSSLELPKFAQLKQAQYTVSTTTEDTGLYVTLPTQTGSWQDSFNNLPVQEVRNGVVYQYRYYVEEDKEHSTVPEGYDYEIIYTDQYTDNDHYHVYNENHSPETASTGTQTVINRELLDVPVNKFWEDFDNDDFSDDSENPESHDVYSWSAILQLDYRNVPLDSELDPTEWTPYKPEDPNTKVEITKEDNQNHVQHYFYDLPMYVVDETLGECRREYSVVETEYHVTKNGEAYLDYVETPGQEPRYTLWFEHDAGETHVGGEVSVDDYNIVVHNMLQNREIVNGITLDVQKSWPNEVAANYAKFRLKRNVIVEYRNYEDDAASVGGIANLEWVNIALVTGTDGNDRPVTQTLRVPKNHQEMYVRGYLKPGADGYIRFTDDSDINPKEYHVTNTGSSPQVFKIPISTDSDKTITLKPENDSGAYYVLGGNNGFWLSESNQIQSERVDPNFSLEFELKDSNQWTQHFPIPDPNHDPDSDYNKYLPVREISTLDQDQLTANTYIYTYFFEEVESDPEGFYATFTDANGHILIGDESNVVNYSTTIAAVNRPILFDILKIDKKDNNWKLPGAEFEFRKLAGNPPTAAAGGTFGTDASFEPMELPSTDANGIITISGNPAGSGLKPGYYEVKETKPPTGHILVKDMVFYLKVEDNGDIKLMEKADADGNGIVLVEGGNTAVNGMVTLSAESGINGKTITFKVENEPGAALPSTGGPGTKSFYLLGGILTLGAGLLFMRRRRTT